MKIEKEKLQLRTIKLTPAAGGGTLYVPDSGENFKLNSLQYSYLDVLKNGTSLEGLVHFFLGQGWLVSFRELYTLLRFLLSEKIILNASFREYFHRADAHEMPMVFSSIASMTPTPAKVNPADLPFFRSLEPRLAEYLLQKTERFQVPAQIRLTHAGQAERDLYVIVKGQAAIYRPIDDTRRQFVATLSDGSLFGERGFLLNQRRNADVITTTPSEVLRIRHLPEFDQLIKTEKAQTLQHRFWVMHALLSSPLFKDLPTDSLDALIFQGKLYQAKANQVLFQEGQHGESCFILIQGSAVVSQKGRNINVLNQGACFGEISLLLSGGIRTATIATQTDCVLLEIHRNDFYKMLSQNILLANEIETLAVARIANDQKR